MDIRFDGKRALVTGAASGLGRCVATSLSAGGAHVIALDMSETGLASLKKEHPGIDTVLCDISKWEETRNIVEGLGEIHLLVNSAAVLSLQEALNAAPEEFDRLFSINVRAVLNISQVVAKGMIARKSGGSIVHVSSGASIMAFSGFIVYSATKAALDQMMRVMALEWGAHQIRVNTVRPSAMNATQMGQQVVQLAPQGWMEGVITRTPQRKLLKVDDVCRAIIYLLSDKSDMINGTALAIDGGFFVS